MAGLFDRRFATDLDSGGFVVKHSSSGRPTVVSEEARLQAARLELQALLLLMSSEVAEARHGAGAGGDDADVIKVS